MTTRWKRSRGLVAEQLKGLDADRRSHGRSAGRDGADGPGADVPLGRRARSRPSARFVPPRDLPQTRGDTDGRAEGGVFLVQVIGGAAEDDVAGGEPRRQDQLVAAPRRARLAKRSNTSCSASAATQAWTASSSWAGGRPEDRHDPVAADAVDCPLTAVDGVDEQRHDAGLESIGHVRLEAVD